MYIAKQYIETRFKRTFNKGDIVPDEIAKFYTREVELKDGELLIDDSSDVVPEVSETQDSLTEVQEVPEVPEVQEVPETKDNISEDIKPLEDFKTKKSLEKYAKTFGIELDRRETLEHMYEEFKESLK